DETRVILEKAPSGDYINASHVNMEILSTGIVNRYIATQGPLPHTSGDFWYMVWEQCSTTIVMLTTTVENGRIKCHQYWPQKKETLEFGQLVITNLGERSDRYCFYRELSVKNK
ncbi:UNVERIFIED_CONTAM: Tyrosine-protein phosphatase 1, partial [Eudyptes robustus]